MSDYFTDSQIKIKIIFL